MLVSIITADDPALRDRSLAEACAELDPSALLAECAELDSFRRESDNLYHRVRALPVDELGVQILRRGEHYQCVETPRGRLYHSDNPNNDLAQLTFRRYIGSRHDPVLAKGLALWTRAGVGELDLALTDTAPVLERVRRATHASDLNALAWEDERRRSVRGTVHRKW